MIVVSLLIAENAENGNRNVNLQKNCDMFTDVILFSCENEL